MIYNRNFFFGSMQTYFEIEYCYGLTWASVAQPNMRSHPDLVWPSSGSVIWPKKEALSTKQKKKNNKLNKRKQKKNNKHMKVTLLKFHTVKGVMFMISIREQTVMWHAIWGHFRWCLIIHREDNLWQKSSNLCFTASSKEAQNYPANIFSRLCTYMVKQEINIHGNFFSWEWFTFENKSFQRFNKP